MLITQSTFLLHAQTLDRTRLSTAYHHYLNFQLDSCSLSLAKTANSPEAFYLQLLLANTRVLFNDGTNAYKNSKHLEAELLEKLSESNFNEAESNFLKAEIKLQWALLRLKNGEELSAFWNLKQAYSIAESNIALYPKYLPSYKSIGLMHILLAAIPEKHQWLPSLFGMEANTTLGIANLEKVYENKGFYSLESGLVISLIYTYWLNQPDKAIEKIKNIHSRHRFLTIDYALALSMMKNAQSEQALSIVETALVYYPKPLAIPQMYYLLGEIYLQKGLPDQAIGNYQRFLSEFTGINLKKDSYYKIGVCYQLLGNLESGNIYFEKSKTINWANNEADKNAQYAVEHESISCKALYAMRYATDGGYYEKAQKIQASIDTTMLNAHDLCEFHYRNARLHHKLGNNSLAMKAYERTIASQKSVNWYFAPNAALQLAIFNYNKNELEKAAQYLNMIHDYDGYPYQESIHQQASLMRKKVEKSKH